MLNVNKNGKLLSLNRDNLQPLHHNRLCIGTQTHTTRSFLIYVTSLALYGSLQDTIAQDGYVIIYSTCDEGAREESHLEK